ALGGNDRILRRRPNRWLRAHRTTELSTPHSRRFRRPRTQRSAHVRRRPYASRKSVAEIDRLVRPALAQHDTFRTECTLTLRRIRRGDFSVPRTYLSRAHAALDRAPKT